MSTIHGAGEGTPGGHPGPAVGHTLGGFEERLLAELKQVVVQHAAAATHPEPRRRAGRAWAARPLLLTGAASAALAAGLAVVFTVASGGAGRPGSGSSPAFAPATTAAAVLHNAALAALAEPAAIPRPGQFVYSKVYTNEVGWSGPMIVQTWLSVSGTRVGLQSQTGGTGAETHPEQACVHGRVFPASRALRILARKYPSRVSLHCTPAGLAAYLPGMPARPAALRAWLERRNQIRPGRGGTAIDLLWVTGSMLTTHYLTPAQRAAVYEVLAQTPGLKIVPKAANLLGRTGVGVRWTLRVGPNKGSTYTLVFNRTTYQLLGENWTGRLGLNGASGGEALARLAIVNKAGQLP